VVSVATPRNSTQLNSSLFKNCSRKTKRCNKVHAVDVVEIVILIMYLCNWLIALIFREAKTRHWTIRRMWFAQISSHANTNPYTANE